MGDPRPNKYLPKSFSAAGSHTPEARLIPPLTNMLHPAYLPLPLPELRPEHPPKQLEQDLEARLGDGRVVPPLAELVPDEGVLGPGELVPGEDAAGLAELGADEVPPGVGHVGVADAEDEGGFGSQPGEVVEGVRGRRRRRGRGGVGGGVRAEAASVDVCWEVGYRGGDAGVELEGGISRVREEIQWLVWGEV